MRNIQKAIEVIETEKTCVSRQECDRDCGKCDLTMETNDILDAYETAIDALHAKQHYDELQRRLYDIFGGDVSLNFMVDELQRQIEEPGKPHPVYAKILTYEDAEKWERLKSLDEKGRLIELHFGSKGKVYAMDKTGGVTEITERPGKIGGPEDA